MNMSARIALVGGVAVLLSACGPRMDGGTGGGSGGSGGSTGGGNCAPFCGTGGGTGGTGGGTGGTGGGTGGTGGGTGGTGGGTGGTGGGTAGSGGFDAGQVAAAKAVSFNTKVDLRGVVVTAVAQPEVGASGDVRSNFWVVDPGNPRVGIYIFKEFTDTINGQSDGGVSVGDVVNIDGYLGTVFDNFAGHEAYRYQLRRRMNPTPALQVVVTARNAPLPDNMAPDPFGTNPDGGKVRGNFTNDQQRVPFAGARVHVAGPLTLSNAAPVEMVRVNDTAAGVVYGFELSGPNVPAGLLVVNGNTFSLSDGGAGDGSGRPACDYRQMVADGGRMVTFPNGVRGVWDTFSQSPCHNGTTSCSGATSRDAGFVPGLGSRYTYALEAMDCNDLAGAVVTP